ncbi:MAG: sigma-70 family RNA polymerase sigma factor [Verrucomicrobiota bacterium]
MDAVLTSPMFLPAAAESPVAAAESYETDSTGDADLVARCQAGQSQAFETLVVRYRGRVYAMIVNMTGNDADAWDLSQEVFLKAWRALPKFEARSQFFTWLYRITHNVTYDWLRKRKIGNGMEFDDAMGQTPAAGAVTVPHHEPEPDTRLRNKEIGGRIAEALKELSPEHRSVMLLKEVEGLSYQEIAETVGCTLGTVMSRLFYARKRLQTLLRDVYESQI